ncbi:MAG: lysophospholipid acyltransferase family protein [Gammaproteobacteria bacterium]
MPSEPAREKAAMTVRFGSLWRSAVSGLCFAVFAVLIVFAALVLLPIFRILPGDRTRRARRLVSFGLRIPYAWFSLLGLGDIRVEGRAWLAEAPCRLLVANHPCFVDIVVMLAQLPEANCIMKDALMRHPLFAPFARAAGYISNASGPLETVAACRRAKERGEAIVIFPEGSRTRPDALPRFQRGAAQIALRAEMEILPVTITCTPPVLTHGRPWYAMPPRRVRYVIRFHRPRPPASFADAGGLALPLAARRVTRGMENWFRQRLQAVEAMKAEIPDGPHAVQAGDTPLEAGRSQR